MDEVSKILQRWFEECPWFLPLVAISLWVSIISKFFRILIGPFFDSGDVLCSIGRWFKNRFIDFLRLFIPMPKLIAWRLARPGIDYVDCSKQECLKCPFVATCEKAVLDTQGKYIK